MKRISILAILMVMFLSPLVGMQSRVEVYELTDDDFNFEARVFIREIRNKRQGISWNDLRVCVDRFLNDMDVAFGLAKVPETRREMLRTYLGYDNAADKMTLIHNLYCIYVKKLGALKNKRHIKPNISAESFMMSGMMGSDREMVIQTAPDLKMQDISMMTEDDLMLLEDEIAPRLNDAIYRQFPLFTPTPSRLSSLQAESPTTTVHQYGCAVSPMIVPQSAGITPPPEAFLGDLDDDSDNITHAGSGYLEEDDPNLDITFSSKL